MYWSERSHIEQGAHRELRHRADAVVQCLRMAAHRAAALAVVGSDVSVVVPDGKEGFRFPARTHRLPIPRRSHPLLRRVMIRGWR